MSRIAESTREIIKKQLMDILNKKIFQSTFAVAEKLGRSWEFTLSLLIELQKEKKVKESRISNVRAWKKI